VVWRLPELVVGAASPGPSLAEVSEAAPPLQMMAVLVALSLLPFAVVMLTSFGKMAVVLSLTRSALGTQQAPPTVVLTGLAAVLSFHVMAPVGEQMLEAVNRNRELDGDGATLLTSAGAALQPLRDFLERHASEDARAQFLELAQELRGPEGPQPDARALSIIVPAFVVSELKEAFQLGFLIFLPFLVLDMVVANVLLALGMQTLSPSQVSLPFKLLLFVSADGWALLARGLVLGYR
jgi:type III secretion protein R